MVTLLGKKIIPPPQCCSARYISDVIIASRTRTLANYRMDLHFRETPKDIPTLLIELDLGDILPKFQEHLITFDMLEDLTYHEWVSLSQALGARKKLCLLYQNATT